MVLKKLGDHFKVRVLPALSDNYMYLLVDQNTKEAAVVDPVDPEAVLKAVKATKHDLKIINMDLLHLEPTKMLHLKPQQLEIGRLSYAICMSIIKSSCTKVPYPHLKIQFCVMRHVSGKTN